MGRWIGLVALLAGFGMTTYYAKQSGTSTKPVVEQEVYAPAEGGGPVPR